MCCTSLLSLRPCGRLWLRVKLHSTGCVPLLLLLLLLLLLCRARCCSWAPVLCPLLLLLLLLWKCCPALLPR